LDFRRLPYPLRPYCGLHGSGHDARALAGDYASFAYQGGGERFHLYPMFFAGGEITTGLSHFSGYGALHRSEVLVPPLIIEPPAGGVQALNDAGTVAGQARQDIAEILLKAQEDWEAGGSDPALCGGGTVWPPTLIDGWSRGYGELFAVKTFQRTISHSWGEWSSSVVEDTTLRLHHRPQCAQ